MITITLHANAIRYYMHYMGMVYEQWLDMIDTFHSRIMGARFQQDGRNIFFCVRKQIFFTFGCTDVCVLCCLCALMLGFSSHSGSKFGLVPCIHQTFSWKVSRHSSIWIILTYRFRTLIFRFIPVKRLTGDHMLWWNGLEHHNLEISLERNEV